MTKRLRRIEIQTVVRYNGNNTLWEALYLAARTVQHDACILIIEDDRNMQQQLSQWLTTRNYRLITAEDQKQG